MEIGDDAYLVPIEGELDKADNLIPLKWVYQQLADCKARQKVLILDVGRNNPTLGAERPGTGPMGPKFAALLNAPPAGVQVWSACGAGQFSYETDASPMGVFLDKMLTALEKGLPNKIQRPEEAIPIEQYNALVAGLIKCGIGTAEIGANAVAHGPRNRGQRAL